MKTMRIFQFSHFYHHHPHEIDSGNKKKNGNKNYCQKIDTIKNETLSHLSFTVNRKEFSFL
jgi:hypothetical protein